MANLAVDLPLAIARGTDTATGSNRVSIGSTVSVPGAVSDRFLCLATGSQTQLEWQHPLAIARGTDTATKNIASAPGAVSDRFPCLATGS